MLFSELLLFFPSLLNQTHKLQKKTQIFRICSYFQSKPHYTTSRFLSDFTQLDRHYRMSRILSDFTLLRYYRTSRILSDFTQLDRHLIKSWTLYTTSDKIQTSDKILDVVYNVQDFIRFHPTWQTLQRPRFDQISPYLTDIIQRPEFYQISPYLTDIIFHENNIKIKNV